MSIGAKGCVVFAAEPVRDFRGFLGIDDPYSHAHWLFQHNGGVFLPPWGKIEQWLISVQHDEVGYRSACSNFAAFATAVTSSAARFRSCFACLVTLLSKRPCAYADAVVPVIDGLFSQGSPRCYPLRDSPDRAARPGRPATRTGRDPDPGQQLPPWADPQTTEESAKEPS